MPKATHDSTTPTRHGDALALLTGLAAEAATHPDTGLFTLLDRVADLRGQIETARRDMTKAQRKAMAVACQEAVGLSETIAATPARTPEGLRAKALYALGDQGPDKPLDTEWIYAPAFSALRDFLAMGRA